MEAEALLILGVGNLLMGDEGVGIHAVRALEAEDLGPGVEVLDGGTGGFHLLSCFEDHQVVVLVDATMDGAAPGTVRVLQPRFASDFPRSLSAHDIGLRDLIEAASLLGPLPRVFLITISVASINDMTVELSPEAAGSLPEVLTRVRAIVAAELEGGGAS